MPPAPKVSVSREKARFLASEKSTTKTLTPQRKHRKLLKDGSSEVWPESIETIFVQGLRKYWASPWATYSRGRSRWRNQFLVDYLHKAGVHRTKKQVASHIQVLRNMWKGEPEFQLVAGGEELLQEPHSLTPIKLECDSKPLNLDDSDPLSPMSTSAHSTCSSGLAGDTTHESSTLPSTDFSGPHLRPDSCSLIGHGEDLHAPGVELRYPFGRRTLTGRTHSGTSLGDTSRSPLSPLTSLPSSPVEQGSDVARIFEANSPPLTSNSQRDKKIWTENKICSLALWTEGMLPFTVSSGAVSSNNFSAREPIVFRVRLTLPSIGDLQCPPTLHGFQGTVSLSFPWQFSAQCITKAYTDRVCISEEVGYLQLISSHATNSYGPRMVQALLPESLLSRSRWLDATLQTCITQQIVADGFPLASIIYDLDRNDTGTASAQLQATQRRLQGESTRLSLPDHVPSTHLPSDDFLNIPTPFIPRLNRRPDSLSCETNHVPSFFPSPLF